MFPVHTFDHCDVRREAYATMKFSTLAVNLAFATSALALPSTLSSSATNQPACAYPIGKAGGANAKVSGRLFEIDGEVQYFAGSFIPKTLSCCSS
jgi:hypothetical protein